MKQYILNDYITDEVRMVKPMMEINGFKVRPGFFDLNGASEFSCGVNFTVHTSHGTSCDLLLFHPDEEEPYAVIPFPESYKIGDVYSMIVYDLKAEEFEYAYRVDGPYDEKKGLLFDKTKILLDPYAQAVAGQQVWGKKRTRTYHAKVVRDTFDWGVQPQSSREMSDLIIYELHVRGFTQHPSSGVKHPGTFAGLKEKIPYLKELGINAVELMPIFEFDEMINAREVDGKQLVEYWGYNTVGFFSPNASYAAAEEVNNEGTELKELIRELHENGIEVILDVVFNHTAEGNEQGPFFSFKGFDNNIYYLLTPEGHYYNFSGCGNSLNCNHPVVQQMILECLRHWTVHYRVDGFRFDLASILGRDEDGMPMNNPPLLRSLAYDPLLRNVKLIAEAWDAGGLYQVGSFPAFRRWSEWNGRYRDDVREYLKGGLWAAGAALQRIAGSPDIYDTRIRGKHASVNFLTCHDGFTLYDLYSYNQKHNEANGWGNLDGSDDNRSWNCGAEGDTDQVMVVELRHRMMKNAFAVLLCSRGTPMFLAGDEFGNTQFGNNNAYCQDNEISWLDWTRKEKFQDVFDFCAYMTAFRKRHPSITGDAGASSLGFPEISFHGEVPWKLDFSRPEIRTAAVMFAGYDHKMAKEDCVYLLMTPYWEGVWIELPQLPGGYSWHVAVNTGDKKQEIYQNPVRISEERILVGPRSVIVLEADQQ